MITAALSLPAAAQVGRTQSPDANGDVERWAVEWIAPGALNRKGVSRDTLRSGDEIILTVRPSRVSDEYRAMMLTLERPKDGLTWGTNPDEVVDQRYA